MKERWFICMSHATSTSEIKFIIMNPINDDIWSVHAFQRTIYKMDRDSLEKFIFALYYKPHRFIKEEWMKLLHSQPLEDWGVLKEILILEDKLYKVFLDYSGNYGLYECNDCGWMHRCICYGTFNP